MKLAETVTFGGSGLDRAAQLRGNLTETDISQGQSIVIWRGKVLVVNKDNPNLAMLSCTHPIVADAPQIFLGRDDGTMLFATDISIWEPPSDQEAQSLGFFDPTEQRHPDLPASHVFLELRGCMNALSARDCELAATARALFQWHQSHKFCSRCGGRSAMTQSGWQRNCNDCNASHFPRTDPVVIMLITHGNDILLGRSPNFPEKMYSLLAGFLEPGETIEAAVRREVLEETNVEVGPVTYLASQPWAFPNSLMIGCHGHAKSKQITIDPHEIEDALWISKSEMMDVFAGTNDTLFPARPGSIAHFLIKNWLADRLD
jgi:NAD+ diphosphatase